MHYSEAALEAAARLAARHLRDYRLPDSAIDVLDEAGAQCCALRRPEAGRRRREAGGQGPDGTAGEARPAADETEAEWADVGAAEIEHVVARMARIPPKQATVSDRERLRTLGESLERVVFGQDEAVAAVARPSSARAPGWASPSGRPAASCSPARPASARPSWPSSSRSTWATSSSATT